MGVVHLLGKITGVLVDVQSKVSLFYLVFSNSNRSVFELKDNWPYVFKLFWQPLGLLGSSVGLLRCQFATGWKEIWSTNNATVDVVKNGCTLRKIDLSNWAVLHAISWSWVASILQNWPWVTDVTLVLEPLITWKSASLRFRCIDLFSTIPFRDSDKAEIVDRLIFSINKHM